jgi:hypothetical protein
MTSVDMILGTAGIDSTDMAATVDEHRRMSMNKELVLADHFPVEDLASGVEQFGDRLRRILALTEDPRNIIVPCPARIPRALP